MSEDLAGGTEHDHSKQQGAGVERTAAARDVLAERRRQVEKEGWTPDHDDLHADGFIGVAGACYALSAASQLQRGSAYWSRRYADEFRELWPWDEEWRKPKDPRRDLVRAAALILAEIERIDRTTVPDSRDADSITRSSNEQSPDEARDAALEEAGAKCDAFASGFDRAAEGQTNDTGARAKLSGKAQLCRQIASAIRALKFAIAEQGGRKG